MIYCDYKKLANFKLNDNFYVLMDFDKTMSTIDSDDSWTVIQNPKIVNPKLYLEANELSEKYCPIEMDYTLDPILKNNYMCEWYDAILKLYYKYHLTFTNILDCLKYGNIKLKDGLIELLDLLNKKNIPVIILSAGIGNVIVEFLKMNNCLYDNMHVVSNFFDFDGDCILPFNNNIIHTCNKEISFLPDDLVNKLSSKENILLFGDFIEDIHMVPENDLSKTLSFGFLEKNVDINLDFYTKAFDVVLTPPTSFFEVMEILKKLEISF